MTFARRSRIPRSSGRVMPKLLFGVTLSLFSGLSSCRLEPPPPEKAYAELCARCHGPEGEGTERAPALAKRKIPYLLFKAAVEHGMDLMRPIENVDDVGLRTVMRQLSIEEFVPQEVLPSSYSSPETLYLQACARCHGDGGRGKGGRLALRKRRIPPELIRAFIRHGIDDMPGFPSLTEEQLSALSDYVARLK